MRIYLHLLFFFHGILITIPGHSQKNLKPWDKKFELVLVKDLLAKEAAHASKLEADSALGQY